MAPLLGYWNIRGLAQPIRLMMGYAGKELEEKRYNYGPAPEFDRGEWLKEKETLGLDFPNLPYLIDGDVKLTQSTTILRFLARKLMLDPVNSIEDKWKCELVEQQVGDLNMGLTRIAYSPDFETLKKEYLKTLPDHLEKLSKFLGERNWFACADRVTYCDFIAYEFLDKIKIFAPEVFNTFQSLKDYVERFEELPGVQKYMESPEYMKWPLNGDMAKFGSRSSQSSEPEEEK